MSSFASTEAQFLPQVTDRVGNPKLRISAEESIGDPAGGSTFD